MTDFSVIIATHNRPQLLRRAIRSIHQQTYPCHQVVVISDSSCLETYQIASRMMRSNDLFIERQGIMGPAASRNLGMKLITGDSFIFLDDDDTFQPDFLENLVNQISSSFSNDIVYYTNFEFVYENQIDGEKNITDVKAVDIGGYDSSIVNVKNFIPNNCLVFPKWLSSEITFDPHLAYEDWDFILSACLRTKLKHLPIYGPRIHKNTIGESDTRGKSNDSELLECYIKIYNKHPPSSISVASLRQQFFSSINLDINSLVHNTPLP